MLCSSAIRYAGGSYSRVPVAVYIGVVACSAIAAASGTSTIGASSSHWCRRTIPNSTPGVSGRCSECAGSAAGGRSRRLGLDDSAVSGGVSSIAGPAP